MKHKLESRLLGEISITSDTADDTTFMAEGEEELKSLLKKVEKFFKRFSRIPNKMNHEYCRKHRTKEPLDESERE